MGIGYEIDHTADRIADTTAIAVPVLAPVGRSRGAGRISVDWEVPVGAAGPVSFVQDAAAGAHSAWKASAGQTGSVTGLQWPKSGNTVGWLYAASAITCPTTVSIDPGV